MAEFSKSPSDILTVISEHVALKKVGRKYKGLCPFHQERTASFIVDPPRERFYCFGCHAYGSVEDFQARIAAQSSTGAS